MKMQIAFSTLFCHLSVLHSVTSQTIVTETYSLPFVLYILQTEPISISINILNVFIDLNYDFFKNPI